jgi:Protein of unknown function (DUF721).
MAEYRKIKGIQRKEALDMSRLMKMFVRHYKLTSSLNTQRVFEAWDAVSGVKDLTLRKFFRDGKFFVTVSSSMVRSHLEFQKASMIQAMNEHLRKDSLFDPEDSRVGFVKELIIK